MRPIARPLPPSSSTLLALLTRTPDRPDTGSFVFSDIRLGSRGDSYYEYLSKQYFQTNRTEPVYLDMHNEAMSGIKKILLKKSATKNLMYVSELLPRRKAEGTLYVSSSCAPLVHSPDLRSSQRDGRHSESVLFSARRLATGLTLRLSPSQQDHLVCFLGATFLLGASDANTLPLPPDESTFSESQLDDWVAGKGLIRTCVDTYTSSKTGLAPEVRLLSFRGHEAQADFLVRRLSTSTSAPRTPQPRSATGSSTRAS